MQQAMIQQQQQLQIQTLQS
jgi:hypothetical protein